MKIKNYLLENYLIKDKLDECFKNINGFDFTELEEIDIFEGIKNDLKSKDLWLSFGPVNVKLSSTITNVILHQDGKVYPEVWFIVFVDFDGRKERASIHLNPFGCSKIIGCAIFEETARKRISKAFAKFMASKFGVEYVSKRSEYFTTIKNLKLAEIKRDADIKIKMAKEEYKENVFEIL